MRKTRYFGKATRMRGVFGRRIPVRGRRRPTSGASRAELVHRQSLADRLDVARENHVKSVVVRSSLFRLIR
jgi:hypothetical protein